MTLLEKIPTVVTVGVLVVIFFFLKRHARSVRLNLWMTGWMLVFIHFLAQLMEPSTGDPGPHLLALDMASLQAAAIAFMVSVSIVVGDSRRRKILLAVAGVPSVLYAVIAS
jgi:hypothetical protein